MKTTRRLGVALALAAVLWLFCVACPTAWATEPTSVPTSQPAPASASQPVTAPRVAAWIVQLGDDTVTKREQASRELARIGLPAIPALREAAESRDPEIAARAKLLLKRIPPAAIDSGVCERWKVPLPDGRNWGLVIAKDVVIFYGGDGQLHALSLTDGKPKWEHKHDIPRHNASALVLRDDRLICYSPGTPLQAFDPATGDVIWKSDVPCGWVAFGENGIAGRSGDDLYILSLKDGSTVWTQKLPDLFGNDKPFPLHLTPEACVLQFYRPTGHPDKKFTQWLVALDPVTGKKMWEMAFDGYINSTTRDGKLYALWRDEGRSTGRTRVIDLASGEEWSYTPRPGFSTFAIQVMETYIVHGTSTSVFVRRRADGKLLWRWGGNLPEDHPISRASPRTGISMSVGSRGGMTMVVHDGALVFSVGDGLMAIDLATGQPRWKYPVNGIITCGPVERDGIACFMTDRDVETAEGNIGFMPGYGFWREDAPRNASDDPARQRHLHVLDLSKASLLGLPEDPTEWEDPRDKRAMERQIDPATGREVPEE